MKHLFFLSAACFFTVSGCQNAEKTDSSTKAVFDGNGQKVPDRDAWKQKVAWRPLDRDEDKITGVGVLSTPVVFTNQDVCTTFLIDNGSDSAPGYVITNSHCTFFDHWGTDRLAADEYRLDQPTKLSVVFNHFVDVPASERKKFKIRTITYMTEFGTDVALLEVNATLGELKAEGVKPLKLEPVRPQEGRKIRLIGVPLMHVSWTRNSLHISSCEVGRNAVLQNGIYTAPESVAHTCSSVEGFSGGPLIAEDTGAVVLLNSHGVADSSILDAPCTYASKPCEVLPDGSKKVWSDLNFAQYVDGIAGCFGDDGLFDLSRASCHLPK